MEVLLIVHIVMGIGTLCVACSVFLTDAFCHLQRYALYLGSTFVAMSGVGLIVAEPTLWARGCVGLAVYIVCIACAFFKLRTHGSYRRMQTP